MGRTLAAALLLAACANSTGGTNTTKGTGNACNANGNGNTVICPRLGSTANPALFTVTTTRFDDLDQTNFVPPLFVVFDRPLTRVEQVKIVSTLGKSDIYDAVRRILRTFNPAPVIAFSRSPPRKYYSPHNTGSDASDAPQNVWNAWSRFAMTFQSGLQDSVDIRDLRAVNVRCQESDAPAVLYLGAQGAGENDNVALDLSPLHRTLELQSVVKNPQDQSNDSLKPFFTDKNVELGNGQPSWAVNLSVLTGTRSCRWDLEAVYHSAGTARTKLIKSAAFRVLAPPKNPAQLFTIAQTSTGVAWLCRGNVSPELPCVQNAAAYPGGFPYDLPGSG
ncbi:hypothetical protein BTM25_47530 [Actinomadura rubteroloni]|uniref:Lipoprotein n=1 Tax=Actinomadura rubteroloni TaxID=1926885 RepID=A0A2P4UF06_9ACTN|nr:hypothetical protein [Actinomadura rubteroloni]POM23598.1 hypothetical protein BTM25_47530 [Actinomadura rubteroloni]